MIYYTDINPHQAATWLDDDRLKTAPLEAVQVMCSVVHKLDPKWRHISHMYGPTKKDPWVDWCTTSTLSFRWMLSYARRATELLENGSGVKPEASKLITYLEEFPSHAFSKGLFPSIQLIRPPKESVLSKYELGWVHDTKMGFKMHLALSWNRNPTKVSWVCGVKPWWYTPVFVEKSRESYVLGRYA